jgi:outer membrane protein
LTLLSGSTVSGQTAWSLQRCVDHARENSISIKQSRLNIERARITAEQAVHNKYPRLNGSANYGLNFGRTIDPVTNDFETRSIGNNSLGLSAGVLLYDGGSIKNTITQSRINLQSATLDARQFSDDLALNVVQYYLAILFAEDRLDNARLQVQTTTQQLDQMDRLIAAGSRPEGDRLQILAQKAREEQNITTIENTVSTNILLLKQLLRLPIDQVFEIERPGEIELQPSGTDQNLLGVYNHALSNRPDIQSGDLKVQSAEIGVKIAKSNFYPSISLGGNLNSVFSSLAQRIDGFTDTRVEQVIFFNGQSATIEIPTRIPQTSNNPYFSQLNENLGYGFGLNLSIPIYNNLTAKSQVRQAQVAVESAKLDAEQTKETLKNNIQTALNELRASANTYEASKRSTEAQQLAYNNMKIKYDVGVATTFELLTAKNNLDIATTEELLSRYDYIFRSKVVDYYLGRQIRLN